MKTSIITGRSFIFHVITWVKTFTKGRGFIGSNVSGFILLDCDLLDHVLRWGYECFSSTIFSTNRIFPVAGIFATI